MGHHQIEQQMPCGSPRRWREKGAEGIFEETMKFDERHKYNYLRSSLNPKMNPKRPHQDTLQSNFLKTWQKENLESSKRETIPYLHRIFHELNSSFLIRNRGGL